MSAEGFVIEPITLTDKLLPLEKAIIVELELFPSIITDAANEYDPSKIAIYIYNLAKTFSSFYSELKIANAESDEKKILRLQLAQLTANVLKTGMQLLGAGVPERM
jgi:arginyl-tRNA synthetase